MLLHRVKNTVAPKTETRRRGSNGGRASPLRRKRPSAGDRPERAEGEGAPLVQGRGDSRRGPSPQTDARQQRNTHKNPREAFRGHGRNDATVHARKRAGETAPPGPPLSGAGTQARGARGQTQDPEGRLGEQGRPPRSVCPQRSGEAHRAPPLQGDLGLHCGRCGSPATAQKLLAGPSLAERERAGDAALAPGAERPGGGQLLPASYWGCGGPGDTRREDGDPGVSRGLGVGT